jgi:hypothetical protein
MNEEAQSDMNLEGICDIKKRIMELYKTGYDLNKSPFFSCYDCDGHNYGCVDHIVMEN